MILFISHPSCFLQPSQHRFKNIGKHQDVHGDEYKQAVANMSEDMQSVQDQGNKGSQAGVWHQAHRTLPLPLPLLGQPCSVDCGLSWAASDDW